MTVRPASKILNIPEGKLTRSLEVNRWAYRQNGRGPLQAYVDKRNTGYLDHKLGRYAEPLFVWLQQHDHQIDWTKVNDNVSAAALAVKASNVIGVVTEVNADGTYHRAQVFAVHVQTERNAENAHIYEDAARTAQPTRAENLNPPGRLAPPVKTKKPRRNDPCPCGSGAKYKKCHGR